MIETVVIISIIFTISIVLYSGTKNVLEKVKKINKYDTFDKLYSLNTIKVFLYRYGDVNSLCNYVLNKSNNEHKIIPMVNITQSSEVFNLAINNKEEEKKFKRILNNMGVKTLLFTNYSDIASNDNDVTTVKLKTDINMYDYIKFIDKETTQQYLFRLIAEFNDGTFASINMYKTSR